MPARPRTTHSKIQKRWRALVLACATVLLGVVIAGLPLYVFPYRGVITGTAAAFVLGPPTNERLSLVRSLRLADRVDQVLVSVGRVGWGWSWPSVPECVERTATCFVPHPLNTRGEAASLGQWLDGDSSAVVVVTFTPHVTRARLTFAKCYDGNVTVVGVDEPMTLVDWAYQYVYQTAAIVETVFSECPEIPEDGLEIVR